MSKEFPIVSTSCIPFKFTLFTIPRVHALLARSSYKLHRKHAEDVWLFTLLGSSLPALKLTSGEMRFYHIGSAGRNTGHRLSEDHRNLTAAGLKEDP